MELLVLPVSGGGFVSQLAMLGLLGELGYRPTLTLASSGGNVAAYVAMAGGWTRAGIRRVSAALTDALFARPWNPISSIAFIVGFFQGNARQYGTGVVQLLSNYFTPATIQQYEVWTGTYNKDQQRARLFCNRSKSTTLIDDSLINLELTQSMSPYYAEGDIQSIAQYSLGSASIPAVVPPQIIDGERYVDGGIATASPLALLRDPLTALIGVDKRHLHIIYVNSVDLSRPYEIPCHNVVDNWRQATYNLVRSGTTLDRLAAYDLLRVDPKLIQHREFNYCTAEIKSILQSRHLHTASLLELCPSVPVEINLLNFDGAAVVGLIDHVEDHILCRFWWA
jgi:predicted acylesterase/phospholipase RssA